MACERACVACERADMGTPGPRAVAAHTRAHRHSPPPPVPAPTATHLPVAALLCRADAGQLPQPAVPAQRLSPGVPQQVVHAARSGGVAGARGHVVALELREGAGPHGVVVLATPAGAGAGGRAITVANEHLPTRHTTRVGRSVRPRVPGTRDLQRCGPGTGRRPCAHTRRGTTLRQARRHRHIRHGVRTCTCASCGCFAAEEADRGGMVCEEPQLGMPGPNAAGDGALWRS